MKAWYQSKTILVNLLTLALVVAQQADFIKLIPPAHVKDFMTAILVVNIVLRALTSTAISPELLPPKAP